MNKSGYYISAFVMDAVLGMVLFAVPLFAKNARGADAFQIGVVSMCGVLGYILACVLCRTVSEHVGRKPMILSGIVLFTIVYLFISQSHALRQLYGLMVFSGISMGMFWPVLEAGIADDTPRKELGLRIGYFNIAWSGGIAAGYWVGGPIYDYGRQAAYGVRFPFYAAIATCPFLFLLVFGVIRKGRPDESGSAQQEEEAERDDTEAPVAMYRTMAWIANFSSWTILSVMRYLFAPAVEQRLQFSGKLIGFLQGKHLAKCSG